MTNAKKIRRMLAEGKTAKEISKKLGVPNSYVHTIKWQDKKASNLISKVFAKTRDIRKSKPTKLIVKPKDLDDALKLLGERDAKAKRKSLADQLIEKKLIAVPEDADKWMELMRKQYGKSTPEVIEQLLNPKHLFGEIRADVDLVNKPPHYTTGGIDFLDYAEAKGLTENAYLFNVVKYVSRAGKKVGSDPIEDLKKAQFYLNREIAIRERA